jgi:hypothetical protein
MIGILESDKGSKGKVAKKLEEDNKKLNKDIQGSLDEVWDKIFEAAIMLCPIDSGTLLSTIRIVKNSPDILLSGGIGGFPKAITIYDSTIIAGDEAVTRPDGYPCIYAQWVHDGHFTPWGTWVPPQPFLTDAILMYEKELEDAVIRVIKAIEESD